ncbi:hypothetical protein MMC13_006542 [Lambiella insularis]|nr:hypothetical protein [Lambiella insularis]
MGKVIPATAPLHPTFDPYNSSSTGHQVCPSRLAGTVSWRISRSLKLSEQLKAGHAGLGGEYEGGGGRRLYDTVGAGSREFGKDGRTENGGWDTTVKGARAQGGVKGIGDVGAMLGVRVIKKTSSKRPLDGTSLEKCRGTAQSIEHEPGSKRQKIIREHATEDSLKEVSEEAICALPSETLTSPQSTSVLPSNPSKRPIFASLTIYINGSTAPLVSDHRLKFLLVEHGANIAIGLGRRSVTHVVLGQGNAGPGKGGAGGGLSAGKIQKEVTRVRGGGHGGVKYVGVEW